MKTYVKQALFILAVVGVAKYVNNKVLPSSALDQFLPT